jgi:hypothetical protein
VQPCRSLADLVDIHELYNAMIDVVSLDSRGDATSEKV